MHRRVDGVLARHIRLRTTSGRQGTAAVVFRWPEAVPAHIDEAAVKQVEVVGPLRRSGTFKRQPQ